MEIYDVIFEQYQKFILENSKYNPIVTKFNTKTTTYFPTISFFQRDNSDEINTQKHIDVLENYYFTIDIYAKDSEFNNEFVPSQIIIDELKNLTLVFFKKLNMKKTANRPTPNIDTDILRHTIQYQCQISNRGNINRR